MLAGTDKIVPVAGAGGVGASVYQTWLTQPGNAGRTIGEFLAAQRGPAGPANALSIGTVTTGAPGSAAAATVAGAAPSQTLDLTIPRGDTGAVGAQGQKGDIGATGAAGPKGETGATGATGPKGADGSPAAGAVLYDAAQGLAPADRGTGKGNLRILGWGGLYQNGGTIALTPADVGKVIFTDGAATANLPRTDQIETGAAFEFEVRSGTLTLGITTGEPMSSISFPGPLNEVALPTTIFPGNYRVRNIYGAWRLTDITLTTSSYLLNDRAQTPTDAQRAQWLANAGLLIPTGQCRLVRQDANTIRLDPCDGNKLWINGAYRTIPSGGVTLSNTSPQASAAAGTLQYVYAYWDGSTVRLTLSNGAPTLDTTYGIKANANGGAYTLGGMVYMGPGSPGVFMPNLVRSWFNDPGQRFSIQAAATFSGSGGSPWSAASAPANFSAQVLLWAGETVDATFTATVVTNDSRVQNYSTAFLLDGSVVLDRGVDSVTCNSARYEKVAMTAAWSGLTEGLHTLTVIGRDQANNGVQLVYAYGADVAVPTMTVHVGRTLS